MNKVSWVSGRFIQVGTGKVVYVVTAFLSESRDAVYSCVAFSEDTHVDQQEASMLFNKSMEMIGLKFDNEITIEILPLSDEDIPETLTPENFRDSVIASESFKTFVEAVNRDEVFEVTIDDLKEQYPDFEDQIEQICLESEDDDEPIFHNDDGMTFEIADGNGSFKKCDRDYLFYGIDKAGRKPLVEGLKSEAVKVLDPYKSITTEVIRCFDEKKSVDETVIELNAKFGNDWKRIDMTLSTFIRSIYKGKQTLEEVHSRYRKSLN